MGSQRPLDTTREVVDAVWLGDDPVTRRIWTHPERSGVDDIDLPVITTNFVPGTHDRRIDFHELYWAHLMSETRAVAVLLWLFELARMGPRMKPSIGALYWGALIFLSSLVLSAALLMIQLVTGLAWWAAALARVSFADFDQDLHALVFVLLASVAVTAGFACVAALWSRAFKLAAWSFGLALGAVLLFVLVAYNQDFVEQLTRLFLPMMVAAIVIKILMDWWGLAGFAIVIVLSGAAWALAALCFDIPPNQEPWSVTSYWSSMAACYFIAVYLALYATFLQPYLGDAARYFRNSPANVGVRREIRRQAVHTLESLHLSGSYDRIVILAHSLGTVVAYDMLRAYYSRINGALPDASLLGPDLDAADRGLLDRTAARKMGRDLIARLASIAATAKQRCDAGHPHAGDEKLRAWLVTDFVTLGSPLCHALYLMCRGNTEAALMSDFDQRTREREFPTCPPRMLDGDGRLTYVNPIDQKRYFHHGGLFALTRWTNLYFPVSQLLWGDAIGGVVGSVFGDSTGSNIADMAVHTNNRKRNNFFAHILYWSVKFGRTAPHIVTLKKALDLADSGEVNSL